MNFLAHSHLSFNHPGILVGNMISDFVKGKKKFDFHPDIQKGISLHRMIDIFTDDHAATKEAKSFLKPAVGLYAGAFIDVAYDHFLANDITEFTANSLAQHSLVTYKILEEHQEDLPANFRQLLPYMITQNWLYNYRTTRGTEQSFGGVVRRAKYLHSSSAVFNLFGAHYFELQKCYKAFYPDLKAYASAQFHLL